MAKRERGVYERMTGSGDWWIRYADETGKIRREKAGSYDTAVKLRRNRKNQIDSGEKLPANMRTRVVRFSELCEDALAYVKANNRGQQFDCYRIARLKAAFGDFPATIEIGAFRRWFDSQEDSRKRTTPQAKKKWSPASFNRSKATLSLIYKLGIENKKVKENPAKLLKRKREDGGRVRYLGQFKPLPAEVDYLKAALNDEEVRLRAVIANDYPWHMPEFDIALNTGMRPSEMLEITWDRVDLGRRQITILRSKTGKPRHIPLNTTALAAFRLLYNRPLRAERVFLSEDGQSLVGYKHWFTPAVEKAGVKNFTWYCLRHTFASRLAMAGVDLRTIADLMGHASIQMTMRYAHLAPSHKLSAVEKLMTAPTDTTTDTEVILESDVSAKVVLLQ
jgi:integrase